jgi:Recombinase zinc beta ribbon domain
MKSSPWFEGRRGRQFASRSFLPRRMTHRLTLSVLRQPRSEWQALVQDVYPAYITWEEYEQNQATIEENRQKMAERLSRKQAIRSGAALLTGLVRCGLCSHAMRVIYKDYGHQYQCKAWTSKYAKPNCQYLAGKPIDGAVVQEFFGVLQLAEIDALQRVDARQMEHQRELEQH